MFNTKMIVATIATVATVGALGLYAWLNSDDWNEHTEAQLTKLNNVYNAAVAEFPGDRFKATFRFEYDANKIIAEFHETHGTDERFESWETNFRTTIANHIKAIRKAV